MENKKYQTIKQPLHLLLLRLNFTLSVQPPLLSPGSKKGIEVMISVWWFLPVAHFCLILCLLVLSHRTAWKRTTPELRNWSWD